MKSVQFQFLKKKIGEILSRTMIMNMQLYEQYQCPVSAWIHSFNELDKSTPRISRTSYGILLSANCPHMLLIC